MYGVLMLRSKLKTSHSKPQVVDGAKTGLPATMGPPTTAVERIGAGPMLLYAGPGSKKGAYGRWPRTMSWEKESKKIPNPARTTVFPLPVTSHATLTRGAKSFLSGLYKSLKPGCPTCVKVNVPERAAGETLVMLLSRLFFSRTTPE